MMRFYPFKKTTQDAVMGLFITVSAVACVTPLERGSDFDRRDYLIQTLSLFNQKSPSLISDRSWNGDWLFRRMRLSLVDEEMRELKPDLLILQGVMNRKDSSSENDLDILHAGALLGYEYEKVEVASYPDSEEVESLAVSLARPLAVRRIPDTRPRFWPLGEQGWLAAFLIRTDDQPIAVFNVEMPRDLSQIHRWYDFVKDKVVQFLDASHICPGRSILAGYIPAVEASSQFKEFLEALQLKSTAVGFCQVASDCFTSWSKNELFAVTESGAIPSQTDRIYVHRDAYVFSSGRIMTKKKKSVDYVKQFKFKELWPTQRFGWGVSTLLPRCRGLN